MTVAGVLLAGGLARRMGGGDKPLRLVGGRSLLDLVVARMRPQVAALVLNANGDPARFAGYGLPVAADSVRGNPGPLAGVLAGLDWAARHRPDCTIVVSVATDAPFLPADLVARLAAGMAAAGADLACAASDGRTHPVIGLWPVRLRDELRRALVEEGLRKVDVWTARYRLATVDFPLIDFPADSPVADPSAADFPMGPVDPFFNANSPEDLEQAAALIAAIEAASAP